MNIEILNHNAKQALSMAYDTFEKEEFMNRLFVYISSSIDLAAQRERLYNATTQQANNLIKKEPKI